MPNPIDFTLNVPLRSFQADVAQPTTSTGLSTVTSPVAEQLARLPKKRSHDEAAAAFQGASHLATNHARSREEVAKTLIEYQKAVTDKRLSAPELTVLYDKGDRALHECISRAGDLTFRGEQLLAVAAGKKFRPITRVILELWTEKGNTLSIKEFAKVHDLYRKTFSSLVKSDHTLNFDGRVWLENSKGRDGVAFKKNAPEVTALAKTLEDEAMNIGGPVSSPHAVALPHRRSPF